MLEKIKTFIKEKPVIAIVLGGFVLFVLYFLIVQVFGVGRRREDEQAFPLQVIPPEQRFDPGQVAPEIGVGEVPGWQDEFDRFQMNIRNELEGIRERLVEERRDPAAVEEVIRDIPAPTRDPGLFERLQADITRVEARRGDPQAEAYFRRVWGGIDAYIASQRARLEQAGITIPPTPALAPTPRPIGVLPTQAPAPTPRPIGVLPRPAPAPTPRPIGVLPRPAPAPTPKTVDPIIKFFEEHPIMKRQPVTVRQPAPVKAAPRPTIPGYFLPGMPGAGVPPRPAPVRPAPVRPPARPAAPIAIPRAGAMWGGLPPGTPAPRPVPKRR